MGSSSSPVRLHWRARQRDVDTGEGPRRYRRYLRDGNPNVAAGLTSGTARNSRTFTGDPPPPG